MKMKLFIGLAGVVAIAIAVCVTMSANSSSIQPDLLTQNIEALTRGETVGKNPYSCWVGTKGTSADGGTPKTYCGDCQVHYQHTVTGDGQCYK